MWIKRILLATTVMLTGVAQAQDWKGEGELGLSLSSGNTDTENLNARLGLARELDRWRHTLGLEALRAKTDGSVTAERYVLSGKSDYKLTNTLYAFGALRHERDEFGSFEQQTSATVGVGDRLIESDRTSLDLSAGVGMRSSKIRATGETDDEAILRLGGKLAHRFNPVLSFSEELLIESGSDNTYVESATGLTAKLDEDLAAKFGLLVKHNTDVSPGQDKTDTLTTISLVYSF